MKGRNVLVTLIGVTLLGLILGGPARSLPAAPVPESVPCPNCLVIAIGSFGITHEQTARLNARIFVVDRDSDRPLQPVDLEFMFHDIEGNLVGDSVQTVEPGHAAFLDLNGVMLPIGGDGMRAQVQPCVKILNNPNGKRVQVIPSFEAFDNSGPDAGKSRMGWANHNETLLRDTARR